MESMIEKIYYKRAGSHEKKPKDEEYSRLTENFNEHYRQFSETLNEKQKSLFDQLNNESADIQSLMEYFCYHDGFTFGIRLILEVCSENKIWEEDRA